MSAINMVTLPWIIHTRYLLQEAQQFITNLPEVAMPDPVHDKTMKDRDRPSQSRSHSHF